jgi:mono/diheme cytochrome c family protein
MSSVRVASVWTALVVGVVLVALSGCGGNESSDSASSSPENSAGAKVFADAGCGNCHTLKSADSKGNVGPNLDDVQPDKAKVVRQVTNGGVGMPSFRDKLTKQEIDDVAQFVSDETRKATGGGSVAAGFKPDDTKV